MKKLKIFPSHLEFRNAGFPAVTEFKAVKLSYEQAMSFSQQHLRSFDDLVAVYGADKELKSGESYDGYIAVPHWWGYVEVVKMQGVITKIDPAAARGCLNYDFAKVIREGRAWEVLIDGKMPGPFLAVWTFSDCGFASLITQEQKRGRWQGIDAEEMDEKLKNKLIAALLSNQIVELTDEEDDVLRSYLGYYSYYKRFFIEMQ